jgi:hypothetical protein
LKLVVGVVNSIICENVFSNPTANNATRIESAKEPHSTHLDMIPVCFSAQLDYKNNVATILEGPRESSEGLPVHAK